MKLLQLGQGCASSLGSGIKQTTLFIHLADSRLALRGTLCLLDRFTTKAFQILLESGHVGGKLDPLLNGGLELVVDEIGGVRLAIDEGLDGDAPARAALAEQDRAIAEKSGVPPTPIERIRRSGSK